MPEQYFAFNNTNENMAGFRDTMAMSSILQISHYIRYSMVPHKMEIVSS